MPAGSKYNTKQKAQLAEFLEGHRGEHLTAKAICAQLEVSGVKMGSATVYRQLEHLVEEGLVRKYTLGAGDSACFEFVGEDSPCEEHCFHCICTSCGKLYHVQCGHLAQIGEHLAEDHGFIIDPLRTVFYGTCEDCRNA